MPISSRERSALEQEGVAAVSLVFHRDFKWIFREQPVNDYGVDAHVEIFERDDQPSGRLIGVQVKSGKSYFQETNSEGFVFRGENRHLEYWENHSLPIILVLYSPETCECFWTHISRDTVTSTANGWKITVPRRRHLDTQWRARLAELASGSLIEQRYRKLALDLPLIERLAEGDRLYVEGGQWINKSSGRSEVKLVLEDQNGAEEEIREWGYIIAPGHDFVGVVNELFPWANVAVDEDFYDDYDRDKYDLECGAWDNETQQYIIHSETFEEWKRFQPRIRPYENSAGEFDSFRFELSLNKLGTAVPIVNEFVETGHYVEEDEANGGDDSDDAWDQWDDTPEVDPTPEAEDIPDSR